jgi:hypothetical protein
MPYQCWFVLNQQPGELLMLFCIHTITPRSTRRIGQRIENNSSLFSNPRKVDQSILISSNSAAQAANRVHPLFSWWLTPSA